MRQGSCHHQRMGHGTLCQRRVCSQAAVRTARPVSRESLDLVLGDSGLGSPGWCDPDCFPAAAPRTAVNVGKPGGTGWRDAALDSCTPIIVIKNKTKLLPYPEWWPFKAIILLVSVFHIIPSTRGHSSSASLLKRMGHPAQEWRPFKER